MALRRAWCFSGSKAIMQTGCFSIRVLPRVKRISVVHLELLHQHSGSWCSAWGLCSQLSWGRTVTNRHFPRPEFWVYKRHWWMDEKRTSTSTLLPAFYLDDHAVCGHPGSGKFTARKRGRTMQMQVVDDEVHTFHAFYLAVPSCHQPVYRSSPAAQASFLAATDLVLGGRPTKRGRMPSHDERVRVNVPRTIL